MPYKDPDRQRDAVRRSMAKRRKESHAERESTPVDNPAEGFTPPDVKPAEIVPIRPGISTGVTGVETPYAPKGLGGVSPGPVNPGDVKPGETQSVKPGETHDARAQRGTLDAREAAARAAGNIEEATRLRAQIHDRNAAARDWHAIDACPLCDRNGFTLVQSGNPPTVEFCDHRVAYAPPADDTPASPEVAAYWMERIRQDYAPHYAKPTPKPTRPGPHLLPLSRPIYGPPEPERTEYTDDEKRPFE